MNSYNAEIVRLIQLFLLGESTEEENLALKKWCELSEGNRLFFEQICEDRDFAKEFFLYQKIDEKQAFRKFKQNTGKTELAVVPAQGNLIRWIIKIAAVLVIAVGGVSLWHLNQEKTKQIELSRTEIVPGSYKAILVLDNGQRLALEESAEKEITVQKGIVATRTENQLIYKSSAEQKNEIAACNILEIPRGGEYKLTLPDGTLVHLNSATTLKYPIAFNGKIRKVFLTGEAYFEVVKDVQRPFIVEANGAEIQVYGTSFNVNTFHPEQVQTVLVRGSVGVKYPFLGKEVVIKPGQMAVADKQAGIEVKEVDTRLYTDWKDGFFRFENQRLEDIMNTLSDWYDVDVFYQSQSVKELHFSGFMERYEQIGVILGAINEATGVQFSIQGQTITISK